MSPAIQVGRCTPLVTCPIGTASQGRSGQRLRQRLRETWPCGRETPLTRDASRTAHTVMWKFVASPGMAPSSKNRW